MLNIYCCDVCLPDYWTGHHRPHVSIPVWKEMTYADVHKGIWNEYLQDVIAGAEPLDCTDEEFKDALDRCIRPADGQDNYWFPPGMKDEDLEDSMAYFIFIREE